MSFDVEAGDVHSEESRYLCLLRDEGLQLLADFRRISDSKKRQLIMELTATLAENTPPTRLNENY